jgi:hypothetical protein
MKRIIVAGMLFFILASSGVIFSMKTSDYQLVEIYICEQDAAMANMVAKVYVNRQELTRVSYCTCEGVDPSLKALVKKTKCDPPRDQVYCCTCIGTMTY